MTVARSVVPTLRWRPESGFTHESSRIAHALELGVGGFLLFGGDAGEVRGLTARLRRDAGRPLLIASDLERGAGQQVTGLAELPPPRALASLDDLSVIRGAGLMTGAEALSVGINWVLAPVADLDLEPENPIVQTRSFGADPAAVAEAVAAWIAGCEATGALSCAKHFPGHGRTRSDSHDALPVVDAPAPVLHQTDLVPFRAAIAAGVSSIMTSHVAFPSLDPSRAPATFSQPILGILRSWGFDGLVATDALSMAGAMHPGGVPGAALAAVGAGVDVLLDPPDPAGMARAIDAEAGRDAGFRARLDRALARVDRALAEAPGDAGDFVPSTGSALAVGDWLMARPPLRGAVPALRAPLDLTVIDDDAGGRYPPSSAPNLVAVELARRGVGVGPGGSRVVLVLAEPRASKGRAGLGPDSLAALRQAAPAADLVLLFAHPRLAEQVPGGPAVLLAWHRQRLMQEAAARWLAGQVR